MKKIALSVAALALTAGGAFAADLPSRKGPPVLPPPPPPPMWTGFYAGLNAGYNFGTNSNTQSIAASYMPFTGKIHEKKFDEYTYYDAMSSLGAGMAMSGVGPTNQNGFIGGGQVGYNYQWGQSFVIGLEADIQGTGIRGSSRAVGVGSDSVLSFYDYNVKYTDLHHDTEDYVSSISSGTTHVNAGVDWMGTVRGRLGYLFTPTMLVYATGGLTYGGVYANVNNYAVSSSQRNIVKLTESEGSSHSEDFVNHTFVGGGNKSSTLVGWNVGGGLEWMFMPNWSLKAEAIYWNMGNMTVPTVAYAVAPIGNSCSDCITRSNFTNSAATAIGATRVNYQGVIARAGVNYHFNWFAPAPVVAAY